MRLVAAPDKFRGTVTAREAAEAMAAGAVAAGWTCDVVPLADGGEGLLDVLGGANRTTVVTGPDGEPVEAAWRYADRTAVIESARACGIALVGGAESNDAVAASTVGVGQMIRAALDTGARRIIVGVGGSATTDGGLGAVTALRPHHRLRGVEILVACDVRTPFLDAAEVFAPQKGASRAQVRLLANRLGRLAEVYEADHGVDVTALVGAGAAGGLAGGLAAVGAELVDGFGLVAEELELDDRIAGADLVLTGEGLLDLASFEGKVVGGVAALGASVGVPVGAVVGSLDPRVGAAVARAGLDPVVALVDAAGEDGARTDTAAAIARVTAEILAARTS